VRLKGWVRTSLIDYPDQIATVVFTGGCNFRCPMCHNVDLVLQWADLPSLPESEVWEFLARRGGLVTGMVVSGGEPTLQADLAPFLHRARQVGMMIKLDTNGYRPDVLGALLDTELVDYVAMDVKAPPHKYALLAGLDEVDLTAIQRSINRVRACCPAYEFRTTVVPTLLSEQDVEEIARWVGGAQRLVLQQFRPLHTLDPALAQVAPYPPDALQGMAERAGRWVEQVAVRG
jgi:pyruvate formate lyase activating enzyme